MGVHMTENEKQLNNESKVAYSDTIKMLRTTTNREVTVSDSKAAALINNLTLILSDEKLDKLKTFYEKVGGDIAWLHLWAMGKTETVDLLTSEKMLGFLGSTYKSTAKLYLERFEKGYDIDMLAEENTIDFIGELNEDSGKAYLKYISKDIGNNRTILDESVLNKTMAQFLNFLSEQDKQSLDGYLSRIGDSRNKKPARELTSEKTINDLKEKVLNGEKILEEANPYEGIGEPD